VLTALVSNNWSIICFSAATGVAVCYLLNHLIYKYSTLLDLTVPSDIIQTSMYSTIIWSSIFVAFEATSETLFWLGYVWLTIILTFIDILFYLLPRHLVLSLAGLGIIYQVVVKDNTIYSIALSGAIGYLIMAFFYYIYLWSRKQQGLGYGDVRLTMALGIWVGTDKLGILLFIASLSAMLYLLLYRIFTNKRSICCAFGPFLCLSATTILIYSHYSGY
jgi:prepilin signal peptidase PulO-like enzyme (type II secretory pathway)